LAIELPLTMIAPNSETDYEKVITTIACWPLSTVRRRLRSLLAREI